jgi:hypothetical protein
VHEVLLFGLAIVIARRVWQQIGVDQPLKVLVLLWLLYLLISLLSSVLGRSHFFPAIWQLQYNLKWPLMFGLGLLLVWGEEPQRQMQRIVCYSWLFLVACVMLEIGAASMHSQVFGPAPDLHQNPLLGFGLRYRGPFPHSGYLALSAGLLAVAAFALVIVGRSRLWLLVSSIYCMLVLLAGQRQELIAVALSTMLLIAIHYRRYWYLLIGAAAICVAAGGLLMATLEYVPMRSTLEQSGVLPGVTPYSERAILTMNGAAVADQYFPLGAGLGTYGGVGAMKYDQSLFLELGFMKYWWFRQGMFLVDTFWPAVVAESGYVGALLLFCALGLLWWTLVRRAIQSQGTPRYWVSLLAVAALTLMLANSPSSGALTDPRSSFLFWLLTGAAWQCTSRAVRIQSDERVPGAKKNKFRGAHLAQ